MIVFLSELELLLFTCDNSCFHLDDCFGTLARFQRCFGYGLLIVLFTCVQKNHCFTAYQLPFSQPPCVYSTFCFLFTCFLLLFLFICLFEFVDSLFYFLCLNFYPVGCHQMSRGVFVFWSHWYCLLVTCFSFIILVMFNNRH